MSFIPDNADFSYTADDLIRFFTANKVSNLVVVNPDNPSGNYIPKADMLRLADWSRKQGMRLVVDESFADFADEEDAGMIDQSLLSATPHLYVIKSLSKSYGVPGIRLGVLASGDTGTITRIKKDAAIWNINSFGEFFMQILEKYRSAYIGSLDRIRAERKRFQEELGRIRDIRVIPSQANYIMIELTGTVSSTTLMKTLLLKHNIFVRDLSGKTGGKNYLRLAVRDTRDNDRLLNVLREELGMA